MDVVKPSIGALGSKTFALDISSIHREVRSSFQLYIFDNASHLNELSNEPIHTTFDISNIHDAQNAPIR